ncbi:hypothetical protein Trydic_g10120, partial [Trypoxylus dichotomus]
MGSSIYEAVKPLFIIWKYSGYLSYKLTDSNGHISIDTWNFHLVVSGIVQALIIILSVSSYAHLASQLRPQQALMEASAFMVFNILEFLELSAVVITSKLYNRAKIDVLNKMGRILKELSDQVSDFNFRYIKIVCAIVFIFTLIGLGTFAMIMVNASAIEHDNHFGIDGNLVVFLTAFLKSLVLGEYTVLVLATKIILQRLNAITNKLGQRSPRFAGISSQSNLQTLSMLSVKCEEIFECLKGINLILALPILIRFAAMFVFAVLQIFSLLSLILWMVSNNAKNDIGLAILGALVHSISFCAIELGIYTFVSESYMRE